MSEHNDGGPAFPVPNSANMNEQEGMTLHDYFAGQALSAVPLRNWNADVTEHEVIIRQWARASFLAADEMLAEKARRESSE